MSPVKHYKKAENRIVRNIQRFFCSLGSAVSSFIMGIVSVCRQQLTVMFIPHSERTIFNFRISVFSLIVMTFLFACMIMSFILFTTRFTGVSDMLVSSSTELERKEESLEIIRDGISDLKNTSRVFKDALLDTVETLGLKTEQTLPETEAAAVSSDIRELEELRSLTGLLKESMGYFDDIAYLLKAHQELIVELPTIWPLKDVRGRVTSSFGPTTHPFSREWYLHKGIDIAYKRGTKLVATANGKVIEKGYEPNGYGNYIVIKHKYGLYTKFAHMDKVYAKEGQNVLQGDVIGTLGNTGLSTGPHVHYEVRIGTQVVDPLRYMNFKHGGDA